MNKLGIWAIAIAGAFLIGVLSANPVVEAVGGWQPVVEDLQNQIDVIPQIITRTSTFQLEPDTRTGEFLCEDGEVIIGAKFEASAPTAGFGGSVNHVSQLYDTSILNQSPDPIQVIVTWSCLVVSNGV